MGERFTSSFYHRPCVHQLVNYQNKYTLVKVLDAGDRDHLDPITPKIIRAALKLPQFMKIGSYKSFNAAAFLAELVQNNIKHVVFCTDKIK